MRYITFVFLFLLKTGSIAQVGEWTWMSGDSAISSFGQYGVKGVEAAGNRPPGRYVPANWTDSAGNYWVFGGQTMFGQGLNDLWRYNKANSQWTWMSGPNTTGGMPVYGTQGVAGINNIPGARNFGCSSWTGLDGTFYLFGGSGRDSLGIYAYLQDFWKYNPGTNMWTWISGSPFANDVASYGDIMVPSPSNHPLPRYETAATWVDDLGNLWMFGGEVYNWNWSIERMNDMWMYNIATKEWTWMHGDTTGGFANYGTMGVFDPANQPGGRQAHGSWKDEDGYFWIFGSWTGNDKNNVSGVINDLWKYDPNQIRPTFNQWAWIGGSDTVGSPGVYPNKCAITDSAWPPTRLENRATWTDSCGHLWMYGGLESYGPPVAADLWKYNMNTGRWIFVSGDSTTNTYPVYGSLQVSDPLNKPGARGGAVSWREDNGDLMLYGGGRFFVTGLFNDLWKFTPDKYCGELWPITAGPDTSLCLGQSLQLNALGADTFLWDPPLFLNNPNSVNPTALPDSTQTYVLSVPGSMCYNEDTITLSVNALPSVSLPDSSVCVGDSVVLDAGNSGSSFIWSTSLNDTFQTNTVILADSGAVPVTVQVTNGFGCVSSDSSVVTFYLSPTPILADTSFCAGDSVTLDAGNPGANYFWLPNGENTQLITVMDSGSYPVMISYGSGLCFIEDTATISINPIPIVILNADTFCQGDSVILDAGNPGASFLWSTTEISQQITVDSTGTYSVMVTDLNNCATLASAAILMNQNPSVALTPPTFCEGDSSTICFNGSNIDYLWCNGSTEPCITVTDTGLYCLLIADINGCIASDTITISSTEVYPLPQVMAWPDTTITQGQSVMINSSGTGSCDWLPPTGLNSSTDCNPISTPDQTTTYMLAVTDSNGCRGFDTLTIIVEPLLFNIYIPNAFTPNADNKNDFFDISATGITQYRILIFDRWGEIIFESFNLNKSWNGKYQNKRYQESHDVQEDTYIYAIEITDIEKVEHKFTGKVSVVR